MRPEDYPPQEPFSEIARDYHAEVMRLAGEEPDFGKGFRYGENPYNGVAVFESNQPSGDVLCFIHGGGWTNGFKEWNAFMAPGLTAAGVTLVSIGYRLAPQQTFPAGMTDCENGVAWVYRNIAGHGGDPRRLFIGGHSAGGHYASLLALRHGWRGPKGVDDSAIRGCLPISGVYLFGDGSGLAMRPRFLGESGNEEEASPLHHLEPGPPPFFMAVGEQDFPHLLAQSQQMAEALAERGCEVERITLPGCNHFEAHYASGDPGGPWLPEAVAWMKKH